MSQGTKRGEAYSFQKKTIRNTSNTILANAVFSLLVSRLAVRFGFSRKKPKYSLFQVNPTLCSERVSAEIS